MEIAYTKGNKVIGLKKLGKQLSDYLLSFFYKIMKNNILQTIKEGEKAYKKIYGSKHHLICEGLSCNCHKKVKSYIASQNKKLIEAMVEEAKKRAKPFYYVRDSVNETMAISLSDIKQLLEDTLKEL